MSTCQWTSTVARGVYKPACQTDAVLSSPPVAGIPCPYCKAPITLFYPNRTVTATLADFRNWQEEQKRAPIARAE